MPKTLPVHIEAARQGFDCCGVARARPLPEARIRTENWLAAGCGGGLDYLERNLDVRFDPALLVPGARSAVVCGISYNRPPASEEIASRIASYAQGRDYHLFIREKLVRVWQALQALHPGASGRVFVDTAPLPEKVWAVEAGLGWTGRNSLLINPKLGSFLMLGAIVTDIEMEPDNRYEGDGCGNCRACIEACPAHAIGPDRTIDARRCISRRTVEKNEREEGDLHGWIFGCDICQRVCPYNKNAPVPNHPEFAPLPGMLDMTREDWLALTEEEFQRRFAESPLKRCGLERLQRRIEKL